MPGRGTGFLRPCSANPLPSPLHAVRHFILAAALAGPMTIPIWQTRKLKSKEVRSLVKRFTATEKQNQELTSPRAHALFTTLMLSSFRKGWGWYDFLSFSNHWFNKWWMSFSVDGMQEAGWGLEFPREQGWIDTRQNSLFFFFFFLNDSLVEKTLVDKTSEAHRL